MTVGNERPAYVSPRGTRWGPRDAVLFQRADLGGNVQEQESDKLKLASHLPLAFQRCDIAKKDF